MKTQQVEPQVEPQVVMLQLVKLQVVKFYCEGADDYYDFFYWVSLGFEPLQVLKVKMVQVVKAHLVKPDFFWRWSLVFEPQASNYSVSQAFSGHGFLDILQRSGIVDVYL